VYKLLPKDQNADSGRDIFWLSCNTLFPQILHRTAVSEALYTIISSAHPGCEADHSRSAGSGRIISKPLVNMSDILQRWTAQGREYIEYPDEFVKRSLAPDEYNKRIDDPHHYSSLNMRRLQNEAECLEFVARETTIPVPGVLAAYERNGSFILETERIDGCIAEYS